jgi:hypothetical protein
MAVDLPLVTSWSLPKSQLDETQASHRPVSIFIKDSPNQYPFLPSPVYLVKLGQKSAHRDRPDHHRYISHGLLHKLQESGPHMSRRNNVRQCDPPISLS